MDNMRIFLDQKDFSSIARGLGGEKGFEAYTGHFDFLKNLVESQKITIYFAWSHIVESLRYHNLTGRLWNIHCQVVDTLTKGNCIIFPTDLEKREVELFLSEHFGISTRYSRTDYAFGEFRDAVSISSIQAVPFKGYLEEALKKNIAKLGSTRNDRRLLLKRISKRNGLAEVVKNMSEEEFNDLKKGTDVSTYPKEFIEDLGTFLDRDAFLNFLLGTPAQRVKVINEFFDHILQFNKLVTIYSQAFPELKKIGQFPNEPYQKLDPLIQSSQILHDLFSRPVVDTNRVKADLINKFIKSLRPSINKFAKKYGFARKEAEQILYEADLMPIPSICSAILFCVEYMKRHIGSTKKGRRPRQSDIMDLHNLRNIPYVDLYVTDAFFADLAKEIAAKSFGTKILRNLNQLEGFLRNNLK
jgi:hypothetical protein